MVVHEWRRKIKKDMIMKELITINSRDRTSGRGSYDGEKKAGGIDWEKLWRLTAGFSEGRSRIFNT